LNYWVSLQKHTLVSWLQKTKLPKFLFEWLLEPLGGIFSNQDIILQNVRPIQPVGSPVKPVVFRSVLQKISGVGRWGLGGRGGAGSEGGLGGAGGGDLC